MNETKMMTLLEAWKKVPLKHTIGVEDSFAHGFAAGREGTIPADRAVEIPEVGEWPESCGEVALIYRSRDFSDYDIIKRIPRPQPQWTPRVGEAVFVQWDGLIHVTRVKKACDGKIDFMLSDGMTHSIYSHQAKPFSESAIGKKWSQI